jgi:hypothetical protein
MPATPHYLNLRRRTPESVAGIVCLAAALALIMLPTGEAIAAKPRATLVQPSSTGEAKIARQAVLKQRAAVIAQRKPNPGKTVGGATTPLPKTIVTKRILPK